MPIHDLGYRSLSDASRNLSFRWLVIAQQGVRLAWKNAWLRRLVYILFAPTFIWGIFFYMYEVYAGMPAEIRTPSASVSRQIFVLDLSPAAQEQLTADPASMRSVIWSQLLLRFLQSTQFLHLTLMIGMVAPPLISQDFLRKTFVLYFSRPIRRIDYLFGKLGVVWAFGLILTAAPSLVLFSLAVVMSPSLDVLQDTWDLPIKIVLSALVMLIPMSLVALLFSSLTTSSRYATFAWFALWIVGAISFGIVDSTRRFSHPNRPEEGFYYLLSPYETIGRVQEWIFGALSIDDALPALCATILVAGVASVLLFRRLNSPMRA